MAAKKIGILALVWVFLLAVLTAGCGTQNKAAAPAEKYPAKPVTIIVPYAAGGTADLMARAMEKAAKKHLGEQLLVVNMPGGGAAIGWNELAGAKPDGYTMGYVASSLLLHPLYGQTRYHYPTALDPLAQIVSLPSVAVVLATQPWENANDLVQYAKEHPGEIKFGHSGLGTGNHVLGEMFGLAAGVKMDQVPFRGEAEALTALLGGHIQLMFTSPPAVKEHLKSGKVRVLAAAGEKRLSDPVFKNVPTFKEQGLDVVYDIWQGIAVPKGMPADVKAKLTEGLRGIMTDPEFVKNMADLGIAVEYLGPKEFSEKWIQDNTRLTKVVKETGIAERIAAQKK